MAKHPVEVFGHPVDVNSPQAEEHRSRHWCPFTDSGCDKKSRLVTYPFGVCSVQYGEDVIALCPRRFLQDGTVFLDISDHHFGTHHDLLLFEEVSVPQASHLGRFDYVLARHKPLSSDIQGFVAIEFQTGQTTNTGQLVVGLRAFMDGEDVVYQTYGFGINWADIWKRTFTQILTKGIALEHWGHRIFWVVQESVYRNFLDRYKLHGMTYDSSHRTVFAIYDIQRSGDQYELFQTRLESSTVNDLFEAFRTNFEVPPREIFIAELERKAQQNATVQLNLDLKLD